MKKPFIRVWLFTVIVLSGPADSARGFGLSAFTALHPGQAPPLPRQYIPP